VLVIVRRGHRARYKKARTKLSDNLIRDDRAGRKEASSLVVTGGSGNLIVNNWLANGAEIAKESAQAIANFGAR
jgi:hypothetical protein